MFDACDHEGIGFRHTGYAGAHSKALKWIGRLYTLDESLIRGHNDKGND